MLDYILERVQQGRYELVVWDTAPAGDTLRLLDLPSRFVEHLRTAPRVYVELRDTFNLSRTPLTRLIESWRQLAEDVTRFFTDAANVGFILVTIPEALGVYQTRRVRRNLEEHGIHVQHLIVNNVVTDARCDFLRQRREMQRPYLQMLDAEFSAIGLTRVPLLPYEVKGIHRLREVERRLFDDVPRTAP